MFKDQSIPLEKAIEENRLAPIETFPAPFDSSSLRSGAIRIVFPEFSCVCPKTGYPDFASIHLYYLPDHLCIELKSWKLYLNSFRMVGTFHETVTNHIFETVKKVIKPRWAMVVGDFFPRGNVDTSVVFETGTPRPIGVDRLFQNMPPHCREFE
ncbi:MAG: preQ(1) synthase [Chitinivibrionales bacterium]